MDRHIYGYASLRTGHTKDELAANFQKTKLYQDYLDLVSKLRGYMFPVPEDELEPDISIIEGNMHFDPEKTLQVDVMTSARKGMHHKLDCIIEQASKERYPFDTVIVITSLSAFGSYASIKKYYRLFKQKRIGILFPDYTRESGLSEYSTCGFDLLPREKKEYNMAFRLVEDLGKGDVPDNRGRISSGYTEAFRVAFWLYELFWISEKVAVDMSGLSKNGFHMKADNYEQTVMYREELETFEEHFVISRLVKRNRPVPKDFGRLIEIYEENGNLELACILCKIPIIFPVDYKRLCLKYEGGRREIARCLKLYDKMLMDGFEEWMADGKNPVEFYKECNMEQFLYSMG